MELSKIKVELALAFGEASALFMSQECKGTEIVMPTEELARIIEKTAEKIAA